jgi:hypothetical protein
LKKSEIIRNLPRGVDSLIPKWMNSPSGKYWLSDNYVCLDFETTLDPTWEYKGDIVLACWQLGPGHPAYKEGIKSRWGGRYEQQELLEDINKSDFIVAHNSKFELHWLSKCGLSLYDVLAWCTQIGEFIILGNREGSLHLGDVAKKYGLEGKDDLVSQLIKGGVCPSQIPKELLEKYCRKDVSLTNDLFLIQTGDIERAGSATSSANTQYIHPTVSTDRSQRYVYIRAGASQAATGSYFIRNGSGFFA